MSVKTSIRKAVSKSAAAVKSATSTKSSGSSGSRAYSSMNSTTSNRTVTVGKGGQAPKGLPVGTTVKTNGGDYKITGIRADGSYISTKVSSPTGSSSAGGTYSPGVVRADANGQAPKGLAVGTTVQTNGGNYRIVGIRPDGSYISQRIDTAVLDQPTPPVNPELMGIGLADNYGLTYDYNAIKQKFDEGTRAEYDALRKETTANENAFYGRQYGAQATALDTLRKNHSAAVATGASRGMQAANELSTVLGLGQTAEADSTKLAQDRAMLADKEGAAYAQNAVNALSTSNQVKGQTLTGDLSKYAADTQLGVGTLDYNARIKTSEDNLAGMQSQANASRYTADKNYAGVIYNADKNYAGSVYNANSNVKAAGIAGAATRAAAATSARAASNSQPATDYNIYQHYIDAAKTPSALRSVLAGMGWDKKTIDAEIARRWPSTSGGSSGSGSSSSSKGGGKTPKSTPFPLYGSLTPDYQS